ncbi:Bug family tripartite tricarboxylate transporter substrate binding protein [Aquabacter spiritensis]|uniref:Tripartite-type tricarboxylate transporter receptor subunit TctC n=1 Tax=Aquabacter spiritensis TaxID=933073 RepID=A0A4R3LUU0_9HYPH|nr:tripartite tricarboxylate transporter substrate binding protein [Aquabacter spiritensis]TCT04322.1 tripartite-type tricarboxylate transporter receptor subunit TctC [Aquabacter spiritensis]
MSKRLSRRAGAIACAFAVLTLLGPAVAQEKYPSRPVTLMVGFSPGGGTDIMARILAPKLSEELGQPVVVENRVGASGTIAAAAVARAKPDGYTMLMGHVSSNAMVPAVMKVPYDPLKDFTPIVIVGTVAQIVTVPVGSPAKTLPDFIAYVKSGQKKVNYASSGTGTQQHLAAELFKQATGIEMLHVPYKGSGQAVNDLIAGVVDVNFDTIPSVLPHIRAGTLRGLAVTTAQRTAILPDLPDLPTVAEAGVPGYNVDTWYMVMGPANLPAPIVARWAAAVNTALQDPAIRKRLTDLSTEIGGGTPDEAAQVLRTDVAKWAQVVKQAGIRDGD